MLVKSVTSNISRIFVVANNLQPVRKILERFCKSSLRNIFQTYLVLYLLFKRLDLKVSHPKREKCITLDTQKMYHIQDKKNVSHLGF